MEAHEVLEQVKSGKMTVEEAEQFLKGNRLKRWAMQR